MLAQIKKIQNLGIQYWIRHCNVVYYCKFYSMMALKFDVNEYNNGETTLRISPTTRKDAQSALLDYLHSTRSLPFVEAEHMSKNSPHFIRKLIENVNYEPDVRCSAARFLRYHPINEFEPFFESIGLDPSEFVPLLRRDLMYLSDEDGLLYNYCVLCEYGIARNNIGRIYKGAREVFQYGNGVLLSKLRDIEKVGLSKPVIANAVSFNPSLLIDGVSKEFFKLLRQLQCLGCEYDWVEQHLFENDLYNWRQMFELLHVLSDLGCNEKELGYLVRRHPELLFDRSGQSTYSLIGFLIKFGCTKNDICSMFLHLPQVKVGLFVWNLRRAFELLREIEMDATSITSIIRTHLLVLGSCSLKKANSILANLSTGKKRLCEIIIENPLALKNWVLRAKIKRLSVTREMHSRMWKTKFLSSIGFKENSKEMERALKLFRGKGDELHERFDCLVKAGLSEEDVMQMVTIAPRILNQSKEVIEAKIEYLVSDLGYPVSSLKPFPGYLAYTIERVKLRCSMYKWLVNHSAVRPGFTLSTIVGCPEPHFVKKYVDKHPGGRDVWEGLKKTSSI